MQEIIFGTLIFIGIAAITALVFGGWVLGKIARTLGKALGLIADPPRMALPPPPLRYMPPPIRQGLGGYSIQCIARECGWSNPSSARFCRHCGTPLPQGEARVAMS